MKIAMSPTREQFPLSRRKIAKKTLVNSFFLLLIIFIVWVAVALWPVLAGEQKASTFIILTAIFWGVGFLFWLLIYLYQKWYFAVYFYDLTEDFIIIKKGPITPSEITIPYERVQDVYVDQDIFDRLFRIYDVHLSSATVSSGMSAHIDGVEKEAADGLRRFLLETVQRKITKNRPSTNNNEIIK